MLTEFGREFAVIGMCAGECSWLLLRYCALDDLLDSSWPHGKEMWEILEND